MHHHLHIGGGFVLLVFLGICAVIGLVILAKSSRRKADLAARRLELQHAERMAGVATRPTGTGNGEAALRRALQGDADPVRFRSIVPGYAPAPAPIVVQNGGSSSGFVEGMLLGELAAGGGRETIIEQPTIYEPSPTYSDTASSGSDSGSGFWSFDSGSSSSSDSGSSFDFG